MADAANSMMPPIERASAGAWGLAAALLFVAMVHVVWLALADTIVRHGELFDSDGYAWLLRAERLLATGDWFDASLPGANAPLGGSLHWTRLFDVLLIALALPMAPLLGWSAALYWSGALIGPLLHLATAAVLAWAARPLLSRAGALIAGALTAIQAGIFANAIVGRPDHHMLFALLTVAAFGFAVRALADSERPNRHALAAGAALAVAGWVGPEAQIAAAIFLTVAGLMWVVDGERALDRNRRLALAYAAGLAAVLLIERGPLPYVAVEYDRISIVHLTQAALVAAFWEVVAALGRRHRLPVAAGGRLLLAAAGAAAVLASVRLLFPRLLVNPARDFDPLVVAVVDMIAELKPIGDVAHFLFFVGVAVFALPWAVWRLTREWPAGGRWPWLLLVVLSAAGLAMAMHHVRWALYADLFLVVGVADFMVHLDSAVDRGFRSPVRAVVKMAAILAVAFGPAVVGAAGVFAVAPPTPAAGAVAGDPRPCRLTPLARFLMAPPWDARPHTILASANFGTELLYRTRHRVVATVHHRNFAGILASLQILGGTADGEIRARVRERGIDLILLCRFDSHDDYFWKGRSGDVLYRRLAEGRLPDWLGEVALPASLGDRFRLFRVLPPG